VSPLRYELGIYIPEDDILHSHHRETSILTFGRYLSFLQYRNIGVRSRPGGRCGSAVGITTAYVRCD
jgi:hypothetical protein